MKREAKNLGALRIKRAAGGGWMGAGQIATGLIDGLSPVDKYGTRDGGTAAASGALSGAMAGAALGPIGMGVGAVVGGVTSFLGNKKALEEKKNIERQILDNAVLDRNSKLAARLKDNPELKYGNPNAEMRYGGTVKGSPSKSFDLSLGMPKSVNQLPDLLPDVAISPRKMSVRAIGGDAAQMSANTTEIKGRSHAEGGVKFPGVEVEGGETTSGNFVFSKDLGFADRHKTIAKSMEKNEKRPSTSLSIQTQKALVRKEGFLKIAQEDTKRQMGLDNDIDKTATVLQGKKATENVVMAKGGTLPKIPFEEHFQFDLGKAWQKARDGANDVSDGRTPLKAKGFKSTVGEEIKQLPQIPSQFDIPKGVKPGRTKAGVSLSLVGDKLQEAGNKIAPFASNISNALKRLPNPAVPAQESTVTPSFLSFGADRAEAKSQVRSANKVAERSLGTGQAVVATRAANLSQGIKAVNAVNQAEANANSQIATQFQQMNAQIKARNVERQNNYNNDLVSKEMKQQQLDSTNLSDVGNKLQAIQRDKNAQELDQNKMLLTILQDETGATIRGASPLLKKILTPEHYAEVEAIGKKLETSNKEDKASYLDRANQVLSGYKDSTTILADGKAEKAGLANDYTEQRTKKLQQNTQKTRR